MYGVSALVMMMLLLLLRQRLPVMRTSAVSESWFRLMSSMLALLCTDRVLQICGVLALLTFAGALVALYMLFYATGSGLGAMVPGSAGRRFVCPAPA
ncbi:hypothetical protein GA0061070_100378 [Kosakonia oryziphila]|uniref:Uncharacterized protein n=1 Tax=Kosakonia oryziphila TaxID=1005667 RepID=A0A1C4A0D7_9ENTR|nr:hypothetical protein GA0061070_100378 [Kosakonia oryziphila]